MNLKNKKGGGDDEDNNMGGFIFNFFVYITFLILYGVAFMNISFWSNFIVFICIFCIHIISGFYILKELFINKDFTKTLNDNSTFSLLTNNSRILMIFIIIFIIAFIFKIVSLSMIIAVFDYARYQVPNNNYNTYDMSQKYRDLINNYKESYKHTTMLSLLLAYFIITPILSVEMQIAIRNIISIIISLLLLGMTIYEIIKANEFLKVKQRHADLYVIIPNTK
jgi:hypothetical protein